METALAERQTTTKSKRTAADGHKNAQSRETKEEYYAELRRRLEDVRAGRNIVCHSMIETD